MKIGISSNGSNMATLRAEVPPMFLVKARTEREKEEKGKIEGTSVRRVKYDLTSFVIIFKV